LGLAFTHTGWLYPLFAPLLGLAGGGADRAPTLRLCNALSAACSEMAAEQLV